MKNFLSKCCFAAAYAAIPAAILIFHQMNDPHTGIFVGLWAPTLILTGLLIGRQPRRGVL